MNDKEKDYLFFARNLIEKAAASREEAMKSGLYDLMQKGLIVLESTGFESVRIENSNKIQCKETMRVVLRDKEYIEDLQKEIEHLKEQFNKAEEVIKFYASLENWDFEEIDQSDVEFCDDPQANLGGKRARDFLLKLEGKSKIIE